MTARGRMRLGAFEVDLATGELWQEGVRKTLSPQTAEVLRLLLERPGELVTREELRARLWPDGTFVDFEHGLNAAVAKLRDALGDSASHPAHVETLPKRGYRWIARVERGELPLTEPAPTPPSPAPVRRRPARGLAAGLCAACVTAAATSLLQAPPGKTAREQSAPSGPTQAFSSSDVRPDVYADFVRGRDLVRTAKPWHNAEALEILRGAVRRQPDFAAGWAALAQAEVFALPSTEAMPRAKAAALRASALDPYLPEAHAALGLVLTYWDRDFAAAESEFRRALALDPRSLDAHYRFALLLAIQRRFDEALAEGLAAARLAPDAPAVLADLGRIYYFARRWDEARATLERALQLDASHPWALVFLRSVRQAQGGRVASEPPGPVPWPGTLDRDKRALCGATLARQLVRAGRFDEALECLEAARRAHLREITYLDVDPVWDPLRPDPRFDALLRRAGFAPEAGRSAGTRPRA